MALLGFQCFPSSSSSSSSSVLYNQQKTTSLILPQSINPLNSSSLQSLSFSSSSSARNPNHHHHHHHHRFFIKQPPNFQTQSSAVVNHSLITEQQSEEEDESSRTRLLAQNVPWTCTADDIRPLFQKYGTVVDIQISMYSKTRNRGLVFVSMGSHEEALAAFTNLQSYEFMGRTLNLTWANPKKTKGPSSPAQPKPVPVHYLFIANLSFKARSKDLVEFFNVENCNVVSAEIIFNQNPRGSAGYGFVSFNTKQEAEAALSAFQGKMFMGRPIRVAPSKRFLRQSTKKVLKSKDESSKLESDGGDQAPTTEVEA